MIARYYIRFSFLCFSRSYLPVCSLYSVRLCSVLQDRADLDFALVVPGGVDVVALSFVQKAADVQELKDVVQGRCRVSQILKACC